MPGLFEARIHESLQLRLIAQASAIVWRQQHVLRKGPFIRIEPSTKKVSLLKLISVGLSPSLYTLVSYLGQSPLVNNHINQHKTSTNEKSETYK